MKEYSTFPKAAELELHHQMQFRVINQDTHLVGSYASTEMQLVYSIAPVDWVADFFDA